MKLKTLLIPALLAIGLTACNDEKDYSNAKKYYKMAMDRRSREAEAEYNTIN